MTHSPGGAGPYDNAPHAEEGDVTAERALPKVKGPTYADKLVQAKHAPTLPILVALANNRHSDEEMEARFGEHWREPDHFARKDPTMRAKWATHWDGDEGVMPRVPFPEGFPDRVRLAKMKGLVKKGLVEGCSCGCRGDWVITEKGLARLVELGKREIPE